MKVELNGTLITGRIDGLEAFEVTISRSLEENQTSKAFSSELTFFDDGYNLINSILIDNVNGFVNFINVKIYDECCSESVFEGLIRGDSVDFCEPGCSVSVNVIENNDALNCVKSTLIWDNHNGFLDKNQPAVRYCIEVRPSFVQAIIIFFAFILNLVIFAVLIPLIAVIFVIFGLIYLICLVIAVIATLLPGVDPPDCNSGFANPINVINQIIDALNNMNDLIVGCGHYHPTPFVRDYIENVCLKCGINFQSSILKDPASPYFNAALFAAEVRKGFAPTSTNFNLITENRPILTLEQLLNTYLVPTFTGRWEVVNNVLIFEREDFFYNSGNWIDFATLLEEGRIIDDKVCFSWIDEERPAFGRFEYSKDSNEYIGYEAADRYNDIVEWNLPVSPLQSGEYANLLPFGPARFRGDGVEVDLYDYFADILGGALNAIFFGAFSDWRNVLIMNQHTAYNFKILILKDSFATDNNLVKSDYSDTFCGGTPLGITTLPDGTELTLPIPGDARFNYPLWFYSGLQNNLYSEFGYIKNPREPGSFKFNFEFEFAFNCEEYNNFSFEKSVQLYKSGIALNGIVQELKVDFIKRTISVKGIV